MHVGIDLFVVYLPVLLFDDILLQFDPDILDPVGYLRGFRGICPKLRVTEAHGRHHENAVGFLDPVWKVKELVLIGLDLRVRLIDQALVVFHRFIAGIFHIGDDIVHEPVFKLFELPLLIIEFSLKLKKLI